MTSGSLPRSDHQAVPFYRNVKTITVLAQIAFVLLIGLLFYWLYSNMQASLQRSRIPLGFGFLNSPAGFAIAEGIPFDPSNTMARAFLVGIVNTIRVAILGIILATILGGLLGIARLSSNWLLRTIAGTYVAIIRNTPLLVQLIFWYIAVILKLPRVRDAVGVNGLFFLSNRGFTVAWPRATASFGAFQLWLWLGVAALIVSYVLRRRRLQREDRPGSALPVALLASGLTVLLGGIVVSLTNGVAPLRFDQPELTGFNYRGGASLSPEFFGLLLALTIYTAAFIAEIVRGGILAVSKGQREAAQALGLSPGQTLRLVIIPQALRVIIPPLTNQYLNLTKNSSLGIAIGFPDLFYVATTINNQSGAAVQVIFVIMVCYLSLSLLTSLIMNIYNARIRLVER